MKCDLKENVRRAKWSDALQLYQWANDPECRAMAINRETISWGQHLNWFGHRLENKACTIYIGETSSEEGNRVAFGQVRLEDELLSGNPSTSIDIYIDKSFRGKGLAKSLLLTSIHQQRLASPNSKFRALVKVANLASIQLFTHAGFDLSGGCSVAFDLCYLFELPA